MPFCAKYRHDRVLAAFVLAACGAGSPAWALDPSRAITQFVHEVYSPQNGHALPPVRALAQTTDGYLWVGTDNGLIRTDGVRFCWWSDISPERLPADDIRALAAAPDGDLWVGTGSGVFRIRRNRIVPTAPISDAPGRAAFLAIDAQGSVLVALNRTGRGSFFRYDGKSWSSVALPTGDIPAIGMQRGPEGDIWIALPNNVVRIRSTGAVEAVGAGLAAPPTLITTPANELYLLSQGAVFRWNGSSFSPHSRTVSAGGRQGKMILDRDGALWMGTFGSGLSRVVDGSLQTIYKRDGLTSNSVNALFEDREGNIWAGTTNGLDRFSETPISRITSSEGLNGEFVSALQRSRAGGMWVGSNAPAPVRLRGSTVESIPFRGASQTAVFGLAEDAAGRLWMVKADGVFQWANGRLTKLGGHLPPQVRQLATAPAGLWMLTRTGVWLHAGGRITALTLPPGPTPRNPYAMTVAPSGDLWIGYFGGGVSRTDGSGTTMFEAPKDVLPGPVYSIVDDGAGSLWVAGRGGLSRYRSGAWTTWSEAQGLPAGGVHDLLFDGQSLWLRVSSGLLEVRREELDRAAAQRNHRLSFATYGVEQGMRAQLIVPEAGPRAARGEDGSLWFATDEGVAVVNPKRIQRNPLPPPVHLDNVFADGKMLSLDRTDPLPPLTRDLRIEYTALSMTSPRRNQFRYRLDGFDSDWVEAGGRREAFYTNLRPGDYKFRVIASNSDGVWNSEGVTYAFTILPAFYQTIWFYLLCLGGLAAAGYALHINKVKQLSFQQELVLEERARIARELHDSLLQGLAGATWQLDVIASGLPLEAAGSRDSIEKVLQQMDRSMSEARRSISSLRLPAPGPGGLGDALREIGASLTAGSKVRFDHDISGEPRRLPYIVEGNLLAIGREAMVNAMRHATPNRISLSLAYERGAVRLIVEDDGCGFLADNHQAKEGHWGLTGMKERSRQIGGRMKIHSKPGMGCRIEVTIEDGGLRLASSLAR